MVVIRYLCSINRVVPRGFQTNNAPALILCSPPFPPFFTPHFPFFFLCFFPTTSVKLFDCFECDNLPDLRLFCVMFLFSYFFFCAFYFCIISLFYGAVIQFHEGKWLD